MKIISDFEDAKAALKRVDIMPGESPHTTRRATEEGSTAGANTEEAVRRILAQVRERGDTALLNYTKWIDGIDLESLEVDKKDIREAHKRVDAALVKALKTAAERVRSFHELQLRHSAKDFMEGGVGQVVRPMERVGVYIPGGTASYPSTVLMTVIPARVAGVGEIIITTPPTEDGGVAPATLVAADIAGADRIFNVGGAQAIAAMAYGTESIPKVDKICGPGNVFVATAKRMVYGTVDIDGVAGPTETMILADDSAPPQHCAADLIAQAEHDMLSTAILITISTKLAGEVAEEVERQLEGLERAEIASRSLEDRGIIIVVDDMTQAFDLINLFAPEHLAIMTHDVSSYLSYLGLIRYAGGIFLGENSPEVLGDYIAGPSHVMPTGGSARFGSPLGVGDFLRLTTVVSLSDEDMHKLGPAAATIAGAEGLTAHARAAEMRLQKGKKE